MRNRLFFCLFTASIVMMAVGCSGTKNDGQKTAEAVPVDSDNTAYYKRTLLDSALSDPRVETFFEELKQLHIKEPADTTKYNQFFEKIEKDSIPLPMFGLWEMEELQEEKHSNRVKVLQYCIDWYTEGARLEQEAVKAGIKMIEEDVDSIIFVYKRHLWLETH